MKFKFAIFFCLFTYFSIFSNNDAFHCVLDLSSFQNDYHNQKTQAQSNFSSNKFRHNVPNVQSNFHKFSAAQLRDYFAYYGYV